MNNNHNIGALLTVVQLREMDGKPVWVECLSPKRYINPPAGWRILEKSVTGRFGIWEGDNCLVERDYGKTWIAYAYQPARIDREKWEPCEHCKPSEYPPDHYGPHNFPLVGAEIYFYDTDDGWEGEEINFCPWCGRPLTDETVKEFERRVYGG